jgi:PHD/YefM family antitoxin component YafN of YafNO toxin-antitoxin module
MPSFAAFDLPGTVANGSGLTHVYAGAMSSVMERINALQLRQSLGKVVSKLQRNGEPILVERGRKPVGVLISLKDFQERFVEKAATEAREQVLREMDGLARESSDRTPAMEILRELRGSH